MDNKPSGPIAEKNFIIRKYLIPGWLLFLLALILSLLSWSFGRSTGEGSSTPGAIFMPTLTSTPQACPTSTSGGTFTCADSTLGYTMDVEVPGDQNIVPGLLPISPSEKTQLYGYPTDGSTCIAFIAGNLVFYDPENPTVPVTSFSEPVTLTLKLTDTEKSMGGSDAVSIATQTTNSALKDCMEKYPQTTVEKIVPIYLYTFSYNNQTYHIWKPFQNFTIDDENNIQVQFLYWGDQQVGGGTKP
jgi:hypothetical protein